MLRPGQVDGVQRADQLADNLVARKAVKGDEHKVQRGALQLVVAQAVKCELLVVHRIECVAHHASFHLKDG